MTITASASALKERPIHSQLKTTVISDSQLGFSSPKKFDNHVQALAIANGWDPKNTLRAFAKIYDSTKSGLCDPPYLKLCLIDLENSKADPRYSEVSIPPLASIYHQGFYLHRMGSYEYLEIKLLREFLALGAIQKRNLVKPYAQFLNLFKNIKLLNEKELGEYLLTRISDAVRSKNFSFAAELTSLYDNQLSIVSLDKKGALSITSRSEIFRFFLDHMEHTVCPNPRRPIFDSPAPPFKDQGTTPAIITNRLSEQERAIKILHEDTTTRAWNLTRRLFSVSRGFEYLKYYCLRLRPHEAQIKEFANSLAGEVITFGINTHSEQRNSGILLKNIQPKNIFPNDPLSEFFGTDPLQELKELWPHYAKELDLLSSTSFLFSRGTIILSCDAPQFLVKNEPYCLCFFNEHYENRIPLEAMYVPVKAIEKLLEKAKETNQGTLVLDENLLSREAILIAALETKLPVYNLLSTKSLLSGMIDIVTSPGSLTNSLTPSFQHQRHANVIMDQIQSLLNINDLLSFARSRFNKGLIQENPNKVFETTLRWHQAYTDLGLKDDFVPVIMALPSRRWSARFVSEFIIDPITLEYTFGHEKGKIPPDLDFFRDRENDLVKRVMEQFNSDDWDIIPVPRKQLY